MTQDRYYFSKVLDFWKLYEILTPQQASKPKPKDREPTYLVDKINNLFPWSDSKHLGRNVPNGKTWSYSVECGVYETRIYADLLTEIFSVPNKLSDFDKVKVYDERPKLGDSRIFDLSFDDKGYPIPESFNLSLACWAVGFITREIKEIKEDQEREKRLKEVLNKLSDREEFDRFSNEIKEWLSKEVQELKDKGLVVDKPWMDRIVRKVIAECFLPEDLFGKNLKYIVKCRWVKKVEKKEEDKKTEEEQEDVVNMESKEEERKDELLNSFFIEDLDNVKRKLEDGQVGEALINYLRAGLLKDTSDYIDVKSEKGIQEALKYLHPSCFPEGCWPSKGKTKLVYNQQLAVNLIWNKLLNNSGIFAINGPPGTGKTTLLRDLVAAVVTERAKRILEIVEKGENFFYKEEEVKIQEERVVFKELHKKLRGMSIVVASSNNGAVENVSLELPKRDAVKESVPEKANYFISFAERILNENEKSQNIYTPAWGLISARLGRRKYCISFLQSFWEDKKEKDGITSKIGFKTYLENLIKGIEKPISLEEAVKEFKEALQKEKTIREKVIKIVEYHLNPNVYYDKVKNLENSINELEVKIQQLRKERQKKQEEKQKEENKLEKLKNELSEIEKDIKMHLQAKPGFFGELLSKLRKIFSSQAQNAYEKWYERWEQLNKERNDLKNRVKETEQTLEVLEKEISELDKKERETLNQREELKKKLVEEKENINLIKEEYERVKSSNEDCFINVELLKDNEKEKEEIKKSPWMIDEWKQAREEVFVKALKIHRAFIENYAKEINKNMKLVELWLKGFRLPSHLISLALDTLTLIVPVISTTFASVQRMFSELDKEGIGWLLIDEAGQAPPQHAVGAIWRAKRVVVVGDPNQLEPVVTVPPIVEGIIANFYGIKEKLYLPSESSVQRLADMATNIGTYLPSGSDEKIWVGCPLRVHRRCDEPMFSISNEIAYDGLMVQGKSSQGECNLPQSCWFNVVVNESRGSHWIKEEGEALRKLVLELKNKYGIPPSEIFVISPFRDCANELRRIAIELGLDEKKTGTVHTTQGKEADVVVFVLGGDPGKEGVKIWASSKPNLLNVAVTRARKRLYVIGNKDSWGKYRYFKILASKLKERSI